jgi:hypothetical protein
MSNIQLSAALVGLTDLTGTQKTTIKTNIDLGNVDNTSDVQKNAASATITNKVISGANNSLSIREADLALTDVTTNNASTTKHGLLPKLNGTSTTYLDGTGNFTTPSTGMPGSGTVTTVSVASTNGLAGTVSTATSTPSIALSTTVTGLVKGNGTSLSAATPGTDYQAPITLTTAGTSGAASYVANTLNIPNYAASTGGDLSSSAGVAVDGEAVVYSGTTGKLVKRSTGSGIAKLTSGVLSTATAGTDYSTPTGTETLTNKTLTSPVINGATGINKADVGLSAVDNTSDATKNAASVTLINKTLSAPGLTGAITGAGTWTAGKIGLAYGGTNSDLSATGGTSQFLKQNSVGAPVTVVQPAFSDLSGTASGSQLPAPAASSRGGVVSAGPVTSQWVNTIRTDGGVTLSQPAFSDLSGTVSTAQYGSQSIFNNALGGVAAYTLKGNNTGAGASPTDFTLPSLTSKTTPVSGDILMIADSAASNSWKRITVGSLPSSSLATTGTTNWNTNLTNGWFESAPSTTSNAPDTGSYWQGYVNSDGANAKQTLFNVSGSPSSTNTQTFERYIAGGTTFGPWYRLRLSEAEQENFRARTSNTWTPALSIGMANNVGSATGYTNSGTQNFEGFSSHLGSAMVRTFDYNLGANGGLNVAINGSTNIPSTANTGAHGIGVAGYATTASTNVGAVPLFGYGSAAANGTQIWGINTVSQVGYQGGTTYSMAGVWGAEFDINLHNGGDTNTAIYGCQVIGGSSVESNGYSFGFHVGGLGHFSSPKKRWKVGYATNDGACISAMEIGTKNESANSGTAPINFRWRNGSNASNRVAYIEVDDSGQFSIKTNDAGSLYAYLPTTGAAPQAGWLFGSDERIKENIQPVESVDALKRLNAVEVVSYDLKHDTERTYRQRGVIAQQMLPIYPELITKTNAGEFTPDGTYGFGYSGASLITDLVAAVQLLSKEIAELKAK